MKAGEYIYNSGGKLLVNEYGEIMLPRRAIVRCRDCKCCNEEHYGAWGRVWHCEQFGDVKPDGFCAWGERRD